DLQGRQDQVIDRLPGCSGKARLLAGFFFAQCVAGTWLDATVSGGGPAPAAAECGTDGFSRYNRPMHCDHDIAIVGGGAAGTLAAIQLLHRAPQGWRIALYEPAPRPGEGVAYSTRRAEHLLNVPAGRMS